MYRCARSASRTVLPASLTFELLKANSCLVEERASAEKVVPSAIAKYTATQFRESPNQLSVAWRAGEASCVFRVTCTMRFAMC